MFSRGRSECVCIRHTLHRKDIYVIFPNKQYCLQTAWLFTQYSPSQIAWVTMRDTNNKSTVNVWFTRLAGRGCGWHINLVRFQWSVQFGGRSMNVRHGSIVYCVLIIVITEWSWTADSCRLVLLRNNQLSVYISWCNTEDFRDSCCYSTYAFSWSCAPATFG